LPHLFQGAAGIVASELAEGPGGVRAHERARVAPDRATEGCDGPFVSRIAESDRRVALQLLAANPAHRAPFHELAIRGRAELEEFHEPDVRAIGMRFELDRRGPFGLRRVEGTHVLAFVAAEHARADRGAEVPRHGSLVLDGEVRDASLRVEHVRADEGPRRTRVEAQGTASTHRTHRRARLDVHVDQKLTDEQVRAYPWSDGHRGLPGEAHARATRRFTLEEWGAVDARSRLDRSSDYDFALARELEQLVLQHAVIVGAHRVGCDTPLERTRVVAAPMERDRLAAVRKRNGDDGPYARQERARVGAIVASAHVREASFVTGRDPFGERSARFLEGLRARKAVLTNPSACAALRIASPSW